MLIPTWVDEARAKAGLVGGVGMLPSPLTSTATSPAPGAPAVFADCAARATADGLEEAGTLAGAVLLAVTPLGYNPGELQSPAASRKLS